MGIPDIALSARESEVLKLFLEGHSGKEISYRLRVSPKTVHCHKHNIMRKTGAPNNIELVKFGLRAGLIAL